jgi:hypothetical protein
MSIELKFLPPYALNVVLESIIVEILKMSSLYCSNVENGIFIKLHNGLAGLKALFSPTLTI